MATRWQQAPTDVTHLLLQAWLESSFAFYPKMQWRAYFSLSTHDRTAQSHHRFLPLPSATFMQFHSIVPQHCSLWKQRTLPVSSAVFKGMEISLHKKNSERRTKWLWEGARSSLSHANSLFFETLTYFFIFFNSACIFIMQAELNKKTTGQGILSHLCGFYTKQL